MPKRTEMIRSPKDQEEIMIVNKSEQIELLKQTYAKGASDIEFKMLFAVANKVGADPFRKEIYLIPFWDSENKRMGRTPVVGIDWYRKQAGKSPNYAGQGEAEFGEMINSNGCFHPEWAIVPIFNSKFTQPIRVKCFWSEVAKIGKDGAALSNWKSMPHTMLSKCSEAQGIRKAFPEEVAGVYIEEEMVASPSIVVNEVPEQRTNIQAVVEVAEVVEVEKKVSPKIEKLAFLLEANEKDVDKFLAYLNKEKLEDLSETQVDSWISALEKSLNARLEKEDREAKEEAANMDAIAAAFGGEVIEEMPEPEKPAKTPKGEGYAKAKAAAEALRK